MEFRIKAFDAVHGVIAFSLDAADEADARAQVARQGRRLISLTAGFRLLPRSRQRLPLVNFSQELISLLDAGLSLLESLEALSEKESQEGVRRSLEQIVSRLREGLTLSAALLEQPANFPPLYVATVRASERTGAIREALSRFVIYQQQVDLLRKKLISASIYPAVLCGAGLLVTTFLLSYVVPRFSGIYEDMGGNLPFASRLLMSWGQLVDTQGIWVAIGAMAILAAAAYAVTRRSFRVAVGAALARVPAVGAQLHMYQLARTYRTVGMLLRGGMPAVTALLMSEGMLGTTLRADLKRATAAVREGQSIATAMERNGLTTPVAARMLRVGERGGNMGEMMERIAGFYDEQLSRSVDLLTRLIEPALMVMIGGVIGLIVVLMYFPIFELAGSLQ